MTCVDASWRPTASVREHMAATEGVALGGIATCGATAIRKPKFTLIVGCSSVVCYALPQPFGDEV
jgi:hypothetical protein